MAKCEKCYHAEACGNYPNTGLPEKLRQRQLDKGCENFKDKSLIVELPCRVGDTVYTFSFGKVIEAEVVKIEFTTEAENYGKFIRQRITIIGKDIYQMIIDFCNIGKTVFLSREEAERALEESDKK